MESDSLSMMKMREALRQTQEREAKLRAATTEAAYWIDQGASARALELLREINRNLDVPARCGISEALEQIAKG